nr:cupin domain-containing protein [Rhabdobacter roseus]
MIEEHFGLASAHGGAFSVAHMVAPPRWSEPFQTPAFDEVTIMIRGKKQIEVDGDTLTLEAGQTFLVPGGTRVRYANPFDEPAEYWSLCVPAFSPDTVRREAS